MLLQNWEEAKAGAKGEQRTNVAFKQNRGGEIGELNKLTNTYLKRQLKTKILIQN